MFIIQLIIIQVMTFLALVFILRKIMYSASLNETKRLQKLNQENAKKAEELTKKMEETERQYREKMASAEDEARRLKTRAREEAEGLREKLLNKARQESERIVNQALNSKEKLREEIEAEMQKKNVEQSLKLAQDLLSSKHQRLVHEGLVGEVLEEIEKIERGKLKVRTEKGQLTTPYEVDKRKKEKIVTVLSRKIGKKISLQEKIDKGIIAGIVIKLGSLVIDGSLAGKLREVAEAMKKG